jgi:hypothetical protein
MKARDAAFTACAKVALLNDFDPLEWDDAPSWRQEAAFAIAEAALDTNNPDATRAAWFTKMVEMGWKWDRFLDVEKKTHPGIVTGELTRGGSKHWENVVKLVRVCGRAGGVRMLGP